MEEKVIWEGSPSQLKNLGNFILAAIIAAVIIIGALLIAMPLLLVMLVIPFGYAVWKLIDLKSNHFEITTERIRCTTGIFTKQTEDLELYRIKDFKIIEPMMLRMLSLSNIYLTTSDKSSPEVVIEAVKDGRGLLDKIRRAVEDRRDKKRVSEVDFE
jgi:uncharacterized membrane protein YdbT with pleckstrin-like domain